MRYLLLFLFTTSSWGANLIPNSSFEVGISGKGWMYWTSVPNMAAESGELSSTAFHGASSFSLGGRLVSAPVYLRAGTNRISAYGRSVGNVTIQYGLVPSSLANTTPGNSIGLTNGWKRFDAEAIAPTNGFYCVKFYYAQGSSAVILIDAVQLESGTTATAYAPMYPVECALDTEDANNLLLNGDNKQVRLRFWNDGGSRTVTGQVLFFDYLNALLGSNSFSQTLSANTNTIASVNLPSVTGYLRAVSRLYDIDSNPESSDETGITILPFAASTTADTNAFMGTHSYPTATWTKRERRSGFVFTRDLSPAQGVRWSTVQPTSGAFVFNDSVMANISTNGMIPICNLYPGLTAPAWATNGDGSANYSAYTNYVDKVVARYSVAPYNVKYWEFWNEPETWTTPPWDFGTNDAPHNAILASVMSDTILTVRTACPDCYIIALGGIDGASYASNIWSLVSSSAKAQANGISAHIYPLDNNIGDDPNSINTDSHYISVTEWAAFTASTGLQLWITESGTWTVGAYRGRRSLIQGNYDLMNTFTFEASRLERQRRTQLSIERMMVTMLRILGHGARHITYWSNVRNDSEIDLTTADPSLIEFNQAEVPYGSAVLMAKSLAGLGLGPVVNPATSLLEFFCFTNAYGSVVAAWNGDRLNRTITLTNTTGVGLLNIMGNPLQTNLAAIPLIGRAPRYIVSAGLSIAQLSNDVKQAGVVTNADNLPPVVAIDVAPSGIWSGDSEPTLFKWIGFDANLISFAATGPATNIVYKWKLDSGSYTSYSPSNHVWISNLAAGNHTFYVTAMDSLLNSAEVNYTFDPSSSSTNSTSHGGKHHKGQLNFFRR
jgi:hypothetical protein